MSEEEAFNLSYRISRSKIQEICNAAPNSPIVSQITPMNAGLSAYMVKVDFRNTSESSWMIRVVNPKWEMNFEREIGALLHAEESQEIPIPKIIRVDSTGEIIPESYFIYEFLKGDTLGSVIESLTFEEKEGKFFSYGKAEAKFLNIIPFKKQVKYEIDEDGNMERKKSFFSFLWKFKNPEIEGEE